MFTVIVLCNTPVQTYFLKSPEMLTKIQLLGSLKHVTSLSTYMRKGVEAKQNLWIFSFAAN